MQDRNKALAFYDLSIAEPIKSQVRKLNTLEAKEIANQRSQAFNYLFSKYENRFWGPCKKVSI